MSLRGCAGCRKRDRIIAEFRERIAALEARVRELEALLNRTASNSSRPPSADPPDAPPPVVKEPTGRAPGGQPGHPGAQRTRLPPEQVQRVIAHVPRRCGRCAAPLPAERQPADPEPIWHQVVELVPRLVEVTEHQGHARTCPACGHLTRAVIPAEVRAHRVGPRLTAAVAYLSGRHKGSKRGVQEIVETLVGVPLALGSVTRLEQEVSRALAPAYQSIGQAVRAAPLKHADETGWSQRGQRHWLWTAVAKAGTFFRIHARRNWDGLRALLGRHPAGIVSSDRWSAYGRLPVARRQLCWAHLKREFRGWIDRGGAAARLGHAGLAIVHDLFSAWHRSQQGQCGWRQFQRVTAGLPGRLHALLERGCRCRDATVAGTCRQLFQFEAAWWTLRRVEGVAPTNNAAERALRPAVLWRKGSFGTWSAAGSRFVERMLSVVQTLRQHGRQVLEYLYQALRAHRAGAPTPSLALQA